MKIPLTKPKEIIADQDLIGKMIPYSKEIIFLDEVLFFPNKREYVGRFLVKEQNCGGSGHKIGGSTLLFRGVDFAEMAAQFLGIIWGVKHSTFVEGRKVILRKIKEIKLIKPVRAGELLNIKIFQRDIRAKNFRGPEEDKIVISLIGKNFLIWSEKEKVARIKEVCLVITK